MPGLPALDSISWQRQNGLAKDIQRRGDAKKGAARGGAASERNKVRGSPRQRAKHGQQLKLPTTLMLPDINASSSPNPASPSQAMPAPAAISKPPVLHTDVGHRVLVIYTGGTIGMKRTAHDGYAPSSNFLQPYLKSSPLFNDSSLSAPIDGDLLTPLSRFGKSVPFKLYEFTPLLDSSDMNPSNWIAIAEIIETNYDDFDAFVILHGTDTMSFTASALSFMLENLRKTVVLTGSQVPLSVPQSDGIANLMGALTIAGHFHIPEVLLFFSDSLMRGNRTSKVSADDFDGFKSLNMQPLASVGTEIKFDWDKILPCRGNQTLCVHKAMSSSVVVITLFPGIRFDMIEAALLPPCKGAILRTFGAGNGPTNEHFLSILKAATDRGVVILNITQCGAGFVSPHYATGITLAKAGVIAGTDMTFEAALTKLCYVLGKAEQENAPLSEIKTDLMRPIRGECTSATAAKFNHRASDTLSDMLFKIDFTALSGDSSRMDKHQQDQLEVAKTIGPVLMCSYAASNDSVQIATLLKHGISPSIADYDGRSGLHVAAAEGAIDVIHVLVDAGAQLSGSDRFGRTPLEEAVRHRQAEAAELLFFHGAILNMKQNDLASLLCHCASMGDTTMLALLGSVGCDLNTPDYDGRVALHLACSEGKFDTVKHLLECGVDTEVHDRWGGTGFSDAESQGHDKVVELLSVHQKVNAHRRGNYSNKHK